MAKRSILVPLALAALGLASCTSAKQHAADVQDSETDRLTVGKVQREIRLGMSGAEVAEVLGSPNIVSTDENRLEVWVYDKIATDTVYSKSEGGITALIFGGSGGALAGGSGASGAASKSQRTLTVIVKFDADKKVRDFAYHTSRF